MNMEQNVEKSSVATPGSALAKIQAELDFSDPGFNQALKAAQARNPASSMFDAMYCIRENNPALTNYGMLNCYD